MQESMSCGPIESSNVASPCIEGRHFQAALSRIKPSVNPKVSLRQTASHKAHRSIKKHRRAAPSLCRICQFEVIAGGCFEEEDDRKAF